MSAVKQLRLVTDPPPAHNATSDPARQIFEHWVFMFGLNPRRTKLDALRRNAINAALHLYDGDVQTLLMAVDGMASAPLGDKPESMQAAMREIDWFLGNAKRIEQCLRHADVLAILEAQAEARQAQPSPQAAPSDPAAVAAARERLRVLAAQRRGANG
jgi:hypothetical protein